MEIKKNPSKDLERKKFIFFQIGLVIALSFVFIAFEWKSYGLVTKDFGVVIMENYEDELVPLIKSEPEPEKPKPAVIAPQITINPEKTVPAEAEPTKTEPAEKEPGTDLPGLHEIELPKEKIDEEIFLSVEEMPVFPGGESALFKYLSNSVKYPAIALHAGIDGTVHVSFVIDKEGKITDIEVLRSVKGLDEEAVRVVKNMPAWKPGKQRGRLVSVRCTLPVTFTIM